MYKGTIALNIPVHTPIITLPISIINPTLIKHTTSPINAKRFVNKKQFLNIIDKIPST
jgi:hypothetical protein